MKSFLTYIAVVIAVSTLLYVVLAPLKTGEPASLTQVCMGFLAAATVMAIARLTSKS